MRPRLYALLNIDPDEGNTGLHLVPAHLVSAQDFAEKVPGGSSYERASYPSEVMDMAANPIGTTTDEDVSKGAVEGDAGGEKSNVSIDGQLGHRDQNPMLKDGDTDFPEPDAMEEHTGEPGS